MCLLLSVLADLRDQVRSHMASGILSDMLDTRAGPCPPEVAGSWANVALRCAGATPAELPDLAGEVVPAMRGIQLAVL